MYYKIAELIGIFRLKIILIVPFVLLTFGAVGLVGFLSFINGQKAVNDVASQLREQISDRIQLYLDTYLATPHLINRINIDAVRSGQLDLQNLPKLERYLISQLRQFESVSGILYGSNRGKLLASYRQSAINTFLVSDQLDTTKISSYSLNSRGNRDKLYKVFRQPDVRQRPWYKAAAIARKPTWTQIFLLGDKSGFSLNASQPIYGKDNNELLGVFSVSLNLKSINTFLNSLRVGKSGKIFIIERNGLLVATSTPEIPYVITPKKEPKRFKATEISNPLISATGRFLNKHFNDDLNQLKKSEKLDFQIDGKRQFVQVMPYQDKLGLDWLIVVVMPESDFMAQVDFNTYTTISLCLVTLIIATGIGIYTAHWITKPILTLNTAAKDLAKGKWHKTCEINRSDELGELAKSFNFMAAQLQASFITIKESENRLNQYLEALPVGIAVHNVTGKITYLNQKAHQLLNSDIYTDSVEKITEVYQIYRAGTNELYPTAELPALQALQGKTLLIEDMELHQNGQIIPLEVYATPIFDEIGNILYSIKVFNDITERQQAQKILADYNHTLETQVQLRTTELININKQSKQEITERQQVEQALRESEERFQEIAQTIKQFFFIRSDTGQYLYVSPAYEKLWGLSCESLYQNPGSWIKAVHPDDLEMVTNSLKEQINLNFIQREYRIIHTDSSIRWIITEVSAIRNPDSELLRFVGVAKDITERKIAEQALQQSIQREQQKAEELSQTLSELQNTQVQLIQAEKMSSLGQMVAGIAHEINNPASFIQGNLVPVEEYFQSLLTLLELYQQTYPNQTPEIAALSKDIDLEFLIEDWSKLLGSMQIGTRRIREIILSLRNFSRIDEKPLKSVDIHEGIDNTILILQHRLKASGKTPEIQLIKDYGHLPKATCYAGQLNQVFMNLLSNAIDALESQPEPRLITIKTEVISVQKPPNIRIKIADNGSGMSEKVTKKIFDPFFTTKPVGSGTGLGLSISYQIIVETHRGKIYCNSSPGKGTEFVVEIPASLK